MKFTPTHFQPALTGSLRLPLAALGLGLLTSPAMAQQPVQVPYMPPQVIIIAPPADDPSQNPYLIYVPMARPMPQPFVPVAPAMPAPPVMAAPAPVPFPAPQPVEQAPAGPTLSDLGKKLSNYFTPEEQDLLVDYMKESVIAAFKGEEVFLPPDLAFKLEILLQRMKKEGVLYMDNLMKQLEADLKRSLKEKFGDSEPAPKAPAKLPQTTPASSPADKPAPSGASKWLHPEIEKWLSYLR